MLDYNNNLASEALKIHLEVIRELDRHLEKLLELGHVALAGEVIAARDRAARMALDFSEIQLSCACVWRMPNE